ncbi:MAG TPA: amidohydrolase/deacetylase family metallohydrolase [Candidatus Latescibacteria bacterium]|nr:amidohydrolase/deacetylase family metallohydrolase [Candidatus Latescibacterota bacterium]|tara:strand:- start:127 stop:1305 length:1179 start_codon:yes stop_codon:yes gene_type:complete
MATCDILLRGGHVIDPKNDIDGPADVAISDGTIQAVGAGLDIYAKKDVDVSGLFVTPGLIDIHVHVYGGYSGWLFPDQHSLPNGVTAVVDTGGPGWKDIDDCIETIVKPSSTRVYILVNIVGAGMIGRPEQDVTEMIPEKCAEAVLKYPEHCIGTKAAHFGGPGWESAGGAIEAARLSDSIAMIDFAPRPTRSYEELLERMAPGDMHTHLYASHIPLLDDDKKVNDYVRKARERGVLFDCGHGAGSFWFRIAVPAMAQGFPPDTISTDLHKSSRMIPNATMPVTMSKFLAMGMSLKEVIYRSTQRPAEVIRHPELGHLTPGADADVAVLNLKEGEFGFVDSGRARLSGRQRLECELTVRAGRIAWDLNGRSRPAWDAAGDYKNLEREEEEAA